MKKITLLLTAVLFGFYLNAQVFYFQDEFTAGDMSQWNLIDADGDGNNWAPANHSTMTDCVNSDSWTSSLGGLNPDNYMSTASAIAIPTTVGTTLKLTVGTFQVNGLFIGDRYTIYLSDAASTTAEILAGDVIYDGILSDVMTADNSDYSASTYQHEFDLIALSYGGTNKFLTIRHWDTFDENSVLIDDVYVSSPFADDLKINTIVSPVTQGSGCQLGAEAVTVNITNNGLNPITTFDATYVITSMLSSAVETVTETFTIPSLALDASTDITFAVNTSDLSATDSLYLVEVNVSLTGDQDLSSDTTFSFIASISNQDIPFFTSFNILDAAGTNIPDLEAWGWSSDGDFTPTRLGSAINAELLVDGECALFTAGTNSWAFSPCLTTVPGDNYRVSFQVRTNQWVGGDPVEELIEVGFGSGAMSSSMSIIREDSLNDNLIFTTMTYDFTATSTSTNIGIHQKNSTSFLSVEEFSVEALLAPTVAITSSSIDPCTGLATVAFDFAAGNNYIIDWGDGTTETVTGSPAQHTYTATGLQAIVVAVSNLVGASTAGTTVDNTLMAPTAVFTTTQNSASVSVSSSETTPCNTYTWDFGDGTGTGTGANDSYTYLTNGTYTIELTAENSAGTHTTSFVVTVTGIAINEIDFVNGVSIFPNPTKDVLNVEFDLNSTQNVSISLVSVDGRIVEYITENTSSVNTKITTSSLASGVYILNITTDEGKFTRNVIVK